MADENTAPRTPARQSFPAYVAGHIWWLAPLTLLILGVTTILIVLGPRDGVSLATIFALDVACIGVALPALMLMWERSVQATGTASAGRRRSRRNGLRRPGHRRLFWALGAFSWATGTTLLAVATVRVVDDDDGEDAATGSAGLVIDDGSSSASPVNDCRTATARDPESVLSGEVTIGIDGHHPGWSYRVDDNAPTGFDVELAKFLGDELGFDPVFRDLLPVQRETALQTCEVDLVIANYSMTRSRSLKVDFAGPYFRDESGLFCNDAKLPCEQVIPEARVCVVEGTIAWEKILGAQQADSIHRCLERFIDPDDVVAAYSTDRTILEAYDYYDDEIDARIGTARWQQIPGQPISVEEYGIGLPNDSAALCDELAAAVRKFLDTRWTAAFTEYLAPFQSSTGHKPSTTDVGCYDH